MYLNIFWASPYANILTDEVGAIKFKLELINNSTSNSVVDVEKTVIKECARNTHYFLRYSTIVHGDV